MTYSQETVLKSVASGYAAGICGVIVGHPMDSAKVWLQTKGATQAPTAPSPSITNAKPTGLGRSAMSAVSTSASANMSTLAVPKERGLNMHSLRALYSGVTGPLLTVGLIQSINFAIYDSMRRVLHRRSHPDASPTDYLHNDSLTNVTISSMAAGTVLAFMTSPLLVIKTKQQIMEWSMKKAITDTLSNSTSPKNFYVGFTPHCAAEIVGRGVYFCAYESLKRSFVSRKQQTSSEPPAVVSLHERMASAAASGILCWTVIFPVDALRNRMYAQSLSSERRRQTSWELAKHMYREQNSIRPFYRGFGVTVLRAGPVAAAVLPVYDTTLEWLSADE